MLISLPVEEATASHRSPPEPINHYFCPCDPDTSLCGIDMTDWEDAGYVLSHDEDDCVVCIDLEHEPCRKCGKT